MAPRTIAERAAAGEIQSIEGLTREEQGELLVWARSQQIPYREIIRRYGFTQSDNGLRTWHLQLVNNRPPRVATFTPEDVCFPTLPSNYLLVLVPPTLLFRSCISLQYMDE